MTNRQEVAGTATRVAMNIPPGTEVSRASVPASGRRALDAGRAGPILRRDSRRIRRGMPVPHDRRLIIAPFGDQRAGGLALRVFTKLSA